MRLTKKLNPPYETIMGENYVYTSDTRLTPSFAKVEQKLGQLEDWEEKIEMPLNKFLEWKLNNLIPYCVIEGKVKKVAHLAWLVERNIIEVWDANYRQRYRFHFRDYGKTWALTKEELQ